MWESRERFARTVGRVENRGKDRPVCLLGQEGFPPFPSGPSFPQSAAPPRRFFHGRVASPRVVGRWRPRRPAKLRLSGPLRLRLRLRERLEGHLAVLVHHSQHPAPRLLHRHSCSRSQLLVPLGLQLQETILKTHHPVVGDHPFGLQTKHPLSDPDPWAHAGESSPPPPVAARSGRCAPPDRPAADSGSPPRNR